MLIDFSTLGFQQAVVEVRSHPENDKKITKWRRNKAKYAVQSYSALLAKANKIALLMLSNANAKQC